MQVFTSRISIPDFISLTEGRLGDFFSDGERSAFTLPANAGSLAARYQLKTMLHEHCGWKIRFSDIEIFNERSGKPAIRLFCDDKQQETIPDREKIRFSMAHSRQHAAVVLVIN